MQSCTSIGSPQPPPPPPTHTHADSLACVLCAPHPTPGRVGCIHSALLAGVDNCAVLLPYAEGLMWESSLMRKELERQLQQGQDD